MKRFEFITATSPCPLTGSREARVISRVDRHGQPLLTVLGEASGLVWSDPLPTPKELKAFYSKEYRVAYGKGVTPHPARIFRSGLVALSRWDRLQSFLPSSGRALDVGAGSGEFLHLLRSRGYDVQGVEPNEGFATLARDSLGLPITVGLWEELQPEEPFDFITLFHVLEHLANPIEALSQFQNWLRPGGYLVVQVPNVESRCSHPKGRFHRAHLFHFNLTTLAAAGAQARLSVHNQWTSPDGGNIEIIFKNQPPTAPVNLEGNAQRVVDHFTRDTPLRYLLSPSPIVRSLRKLKKRFREAWVSSDPRTVLDSLYAS